ncbi:MAG: RICIN domain-containing protein [Flavobacterium sp.]|nr:RICIN domain-containing protein [Flavobacterium sp.]
MVNNMGKSIPSTAVRNRTRIMGDVNGRAIEEKRVQAGLSSKLNGGIFTSDNVPVPEPWKNNAQATGDLLPFILWEGSLVAGSDYVIINPSIMEYDGPDDFWTNFWHNSFVGAILQAPINIAAIPIGAFVYSPAAPNQTVDNVFYYDESTPGVFPAPSILQQFPNNFFRMNVASMNATQLENFKTNNKIITNRPADRPIGVERDDLYNPLQIKLDNTSANQISTIDFGYGKGIIPIKYKDRDDLKGDYTVFISIEKVIDETQKNKINVVSNDNIDALQSFALRNAFAKDKVIDVLNGNRNNGALAVINFDKKLDSEKWKFRKQGDYYYISNNYNNLVLDVMADGNGANVVMNTNTNADSQKWQLIRYCDGSFIIRNYKTNKVIELYNAVDAVAAPLGQWDSNIQANQRWFIEK